MKSYLTTVEAANSGSDETTEGLKKQISIRSRRHGTAGSSSRMSRSRKSQKDMDILSVNQIVNQADNILGHFPTFKVQDVDDQDIKQKRMTSAEKKKPTKLQRSVSRSSV